MINDGLPDPVFRAMSAHVHKQGGKYSASGLGKSPRQTHLPRRYAKEIETLATESVFMFAGSANHFVIEKAARPGRDLAEHYMETKVGNVVVSGSCDLFDTLEKKLWDLKTVSAWSVIFGSSMQSWTEQTNVYAYMLREAGDTVRSISVIAYCRDWDRKKVGEDRYPKNPFVEIPIEVWPQEKTREWIAGRVELLEAAEKLADDELPDCSSEERWEAAETFAVKKKGVKRAIKVCATKDEAEKLILPGSGLYIENRPGAWKKCEQYCSAAPFCNQFRKYKEAQAETQAA